ncbi:unnamed protein product [marine sediment metagenome]|uniref:Uncharacterized protein n=1 Tax=marine sediment metagenome TaxID=412755 RepID=X1RV75_9ZZZZ
MKMNFYKYALITMAVLLGFHLYNMITSEAMLLFYSRELSVLPEVVSELRLLMNFSNMATFIVCSVLLVIAIGLYLAEFYACKYIKGKRRV